MPEPIAPAKLGAMEQQATALPAAGRRKRFLRRPGSLLKLFGILCLAGAVGVGGYLAWELWGTGFYTQRAQSQLRESFAPRIGTRTPPPAGAEVVKLHGDAVAIMIIPRIDLNMVVVEGTDTADLQKGPGHYTETAYPWQNHGTVAIAGHRTTYLHPFFNLDKMRVGDPITLETEYGTFHYRVTKVAVYPEATAGVALTQTKEPTLVLTTCNPRYSASERLIVYAARL